MTTEDILILCEHALKPYEGGDEAFKRVKTALEAVPPVYYDKQKVLDKIRADIRKKMKFNSFNEGYVLYDDITEVFDKYKAESEEVCQK